MQRRHQRRSPSIETDTSGRCFSGCTAPPNEQWPGIYVIEYFLWVVTTLRVLGYDYVLLGYETAVVKRTDVRNQNKRKRRVRDHLK